MGMYCFDIDYVIENLGHIWKWLLLNKREEFSFDLEGRGDLSLWTFWEYSRSGGFYNELLRDIRRLLDNSVIGLIEEDRIERPHKFKQIKMVDYWKAVNDLPVKGYRTLSSYKVNENFFVAYFIDKIIFDIFKIKTLITQRRKMIDEMTNFEDYILKELESRADEFYFQFVSIRNMGFFRTIEKFPRFYITPPLLNHPIYAKIYQKYMNYSGTLVKSRLYKELELSILSEYRFFELYILFKIRDFIRRYRNINHFQYEIFNKDILEEKELDEFLMEWIFRFDSNDSKVFLRYQHIVPAIVVDDGELYSTSTWLRPDFIIEIDKSGDKSILIIIDAKYKARLARNDIWQMHTYRDAIQVKGYENKSITKVSVLVVPKYDEGGNYSLNPSVNDIDSISKFGTGVIDLKILEEGEFFGDVLGFKL